MRLLLLFSLFPILLAAQRPAEQQEPTTPNFLQRNHFRAGLLLQRDKQSEFTYLWKASDLVPVYRRKLIAGGMLDWAPFSRYSGLRTQFRAAYSDMRFVGHEHQIGDARFGDNFQETIEYSYLQFAFGLYYEVNTRASFTPYFGAHYLVTAPLSLSYEYRRDHDPDINNPVFVALQGGGRWSHGWEISSGFRKMINQHLVLQIGMYYIESDILVDWPELPNRDFDHQTILRTQSVGVALAFQYQW